MNNDFNENIDKFYNEKLMSYDKAKEDDVCINSLENMKKYMDSIKDINDLDFSLESIVNEAMEKRERKMATRESIYFLILSAIIMTLLAMITIIVSINFIIYLQLFMILIMPFIIIPIALTSTRGHNL